MPALAAWFNSSDGRILVEPVATVVGKPELRGLRDSNRDPTVLRMPRAKTSGAPPSTRIGLQIYRNDSESGSQILHGAPDRHIEPPVRGERDKLPTMSFCGYGAGWARWGRM